MDAHTVGFLVHPPSPDVGRTLWGAAFRFDLEIEVRGARFETHCSATMNGKSVRSKSLRSFSDGKVKRQPSLHRSRSLPPRTLTLFSSRPCSKQTRTYCRRG